MKLSDFKGIFKKSTLTVESVDNLYGDYYEIKLKPEAGTQWNPGEHGLFKLPGKEIEGKKSRAFSLASTPQEGTVIIGTRTGKEISSFKKALIAMKEGERVSLTGPFGWFKLQDNTSPIVMVAGGVGITPIRALFKALEKDTNRDIELIYASSEYYLFEEELMAIAAGNNKINVTKTVEPDETEKALANLVKKYKGDAYYYVSGAPNFIKAIKNHITNRGVKGKRVINDPFMGY